MSAHVAPIALRIERDIDGSPLPTWRDPWVRALLVLTLLLQAFAWTRVEGYQIADSVEFMEIAQSLVRGEERVDAGVIRPIGFSFVLLPFFALADWIGIRDQRSVVWCVTLVELLLGCVLVVLTARIAARLGGRACGLAAGFLVATNPVFLQYSTQPESGIPAGVCIALALEKLLVSRAKERISARDAWIGGLWLGAAFLIAYKTLLVSGLLIVLILMRDRWTRRSTWIAAASGLASALFLQSVLDWIMYDTFGASIFNYVAQNTGSVLTSALLHLHYSIGGGIKELALEAANQPKSFWLDRAEDTYRLRAQLTGEDWSGPTDVTPRGKMSPWFYLTELPSMLPWPAIVLLAIGVVFAAIKRNVAAVILVVVFAANVAATSHKGQKEFRLWLPLLPVLMPVVAFGFTSIAGLVLARAGGARRVVTAALFVAVGVLSVRSLTRIETQAFGGYWVAMDWVNERAAEELSVRIEAAERLGHREPEELRVAAAYNWAIFRRGSPVVETVKLPAQLNMWKQYKSDETTGFVHEHADDLASLEEVDIFLVHLPILSEHPELMRFVAVNFDVANVFYDQRTYGDLGPIFALERRTSNPRARRFLEERRGLDARAFQEERQLRGGIDFIDPADPAGDRLEFLGVEYQSVTRHGFGWITYHWRTQRAIRSDWTLVDRITAPDERAVWDNGHRAAYGALPTNRWEPGTIVSEGYLVVPASEPYKPGAEFQPVGGAYRRGDLLPVRCWMGVREYGPDPGDGTLAPVLRELVAARAGATEPERPVGANELYETPDGTQWSADGLIRVRGLLIPVLDAARLPDDGRRIVE